MLVICVSLRRRSIKMFSPKGDSCHCEIHTNIMQLHICSQICSCQGGPGAACNGARGEGRAWP